MIEHHRSQLKGYGKLRKLHLQRSVSVSFTLRLAAPGHGLALEQATQPRSERRGAMDLQSLEVGELGIADDEVCESRRSKLDP